MTAPAFSLETNAPDTLYIDVAGALAQIASTPLGPLPHPEDAMELQLLQAAKDCVAGYRAQTEQMPRRELVAVALREAERQEWWRDQAEAEKERLRLNLKATTREYARDLQHLQETHRAETAQHREDRRKLMVLHFELVAFVAHQLGCEAASGIVMAKVRERGSGHLVYDVAGSAADRIRADVAHG